MGSDPMIAAVILSLALSGPPEINYDKALDAIAQIETGSRYLCGRVLRGRVRTSGTGAVGPFQISRGVLAQLRVSYVSASSVDDVAAAAARRWLGHLYEITGNLRGAFAAYRLGLGHRDWHEAQAYAARAMNLYLSNH